MSDFDLLLSYLCGRRSIREFSDQQLSRGCLQQLIEAATWAPSAGNRQDWMFSVVESSDAKQALVATVRGKWEGILAANQDLGFAQELAEYASTFADFARAPVVIAVSAAAPNAMHRHLLGEAARATVGSFASAAMAAQNLMLAAHALGLGACCMTGALAAAAELSQLLGLGRRREVVCLIALGHPVSQPAAPQRKPYHEVVRYH